MRRILAAATIAGFAGVGLAAPAFGATPAGQSPGNPNGTGQPSQMCLSQASPNEPGNASTSPGSAFHEPGTLGPNDPGGTGGLNYAGNGPHTVGTGVAAQYDVACYHQPAK
jgi:hypothetical protein